jgi:hypothetical protein
VCKQQGETASEMNDRINRTFVIEWNDYPVYGVQQSCLACDSDLIGIRGQHRKERFVLNDIVVDASIMVQICPACGYEHVSKPLYLKDVRYEIV